MGFVDFFGGFGDVFERAKGSLGDEEAASGGEGEGGRDDDEKEDRLGAADLLEDGDVGGHLEDAGLAGRVGVGG